MQCINQKCKIKPEIINNNSNKSYSIKINKCSSSCNNINGLYAKLCVPDVVKNIIVRVFNLISRTNETRHIKWHETCKCKCRLDASICDNKQRWNNKKCRCECKELIDKGIWDKGFIWNPNNCECQCIKSCKIGQYLGYDNFKCRKKLVDKLVEESSENIDGNEFIYYDYDYEKVCNGCAVYIALFITEFLIITGISSDFVYFDWY